MGADMIDAEMKKNLMAVGIGFVVAVIVGYLLTQQQERHHEYLQTKYQDFYSRDLKGVVTYFSAGGGRSYFELNYSENRYFVRANNIIKGQKPFYEVVSKGVKLYKPAYADTIMVEIGEDKYFYHF